MRKYGLIKLGLAAVMLTSRPLHPKAPMCRADLPICPQRPRSPLSITGLDSMPVLMPAWAGPMAIAALSAAVRSGSITRSINGCWASKEISRGRP
jgi:hypothetical protein